MTQCESAGFFLVRLYLESEVCGHKEIAAEADQVGDSVGYRLVHIVYQLQIDYILNSNGNTPHYPEPEEFYNLFTLNHFQSSASIASLYCQCQIVGQYRGLPLILFASPVSWLLAVPCKGLRGCRYYSRYQNPQEFPCL